MNPRRSKVTHIYSMSTPEFQISICFTLCQLFSSYRPFWNNSREPVNEPEMTLMMISQFNGTSTPKGSYCAKTGDNDCNVNSSRYSLRTALCESICYHAKSEQNVWQDLIPRVRHGEAAPMHPEMTLNTMRPNVSCVRSTSPRVSNISTCLSMSIHFKDICKFLFTHNVKLLSFFQFKKKN